MQKTKPKPPNKGKSKNTRDEILNADLWLDSPQAEQLPLEQLIADIYVSPENSDKKLSMEATELIEICAACFPHIYIDVLDLVWHTDSDSLIDFLCDEMKTYLPSENLDQDMVDPHHLAWGIPHLNYGFDWDNREEIAYAFIFQSNTVIDLCLELLKIEEIIAKSEGELRDSTKQEISNKAHPFNLLELGSRIDKQTKSLENLTEEDDGDQDPDEDYDEDDEDNEDDQNDNENLKNLQDSEDIDHERAPDLHRCLTLYENLDRGQVLIDYACILLAQSLYQESRKTGEFGYSSVANLLIYLFPKMGPEWFTISREAYADYGISFPWESSTLQSVYEEHYIVDLYIELVTEGVRLLSEQPYFFHNLLCNFETLVRSLNANYYESLPENWEWKKFLERPDLESFTQKLSWLEITKKNHYINSRQKQRLEYSLFRYNIEEILMTL